MILPLPTWPVSWSTNSFAATIEGDTYLPVPDGMSYSTDPYDNTEAYWTAFNKSSYTSLKDLITKTAEVQTMATFGTATLECGFSLANGTARDLPEEVEWSQLTSSHEGPCEVWCDDTLVFEDWNCALDYTSDPAKLPFRYEVVKTAQAEAHSYVTNPMPTWSVGFPSTNYAGLIDGQDYLPCPKGLSYGGTPESNTNAYWKAFNASKYTSLKDLADKTMVLQTLSPFGKATAECGFSIKNGTARALPKEVQWHDFGLSHQGPCEVWCDGKLAFEDKNCALNYPEVPASLPYDKSVCEGASMMQSYWIAVHGLPWQLYLNCIPLKGGDSTAGESDTTVIQTTTAPEASTTTTTEAPTATDAPKTETTTDAPETTPAAPTPTTATPTATEATPTTDENTGGGKCTRRM
ncbi:hypothetical protein BBJ29_007165 [Phytophthora kernoviae]|uniref:Uncharacterized protein n=1 Tax=Phytophthora kernoviae TaxID=325452 RepID=A0A3F2RRZ7_9STRA|nr:hypothetical protein BBJ29_007165 [Phytophthora kernoviae]RLN63083.1 hypothetical protein BBP00_00004336 [Phytophthora kernoviae]